MLISWNWLSSLVDLKDHNPKDIADLLSLSGMEVEGIEFFAQNKAFDTVVVGHIQSIDPHPKADKLVICQVDTGDETPRQIVCGATNMKAGDNVPAALPGTVMGEDFVIGVSKLRGIESAGMLCSAKELGLSNDNVGLMILPADLKAGTPVLEALDMADTILEIGLTPNRPDGLSHIGVSREVSALTGQTKTWFDQAQHWHDSTKTPSTPDTLPSYGAKLDETPIEDLLSLTLDDSEGCPRYAAAILTDIKIGPSPQWMQNRLLAIGQRPINNIVDVTNYVLHECGQPLHAFDLDTLEGNTIRIRRANDGERITTIDDVEQTLKTSDVIIADASKPVAVAGVMGGKDTGVTDSTTRIVIECANFNPSLVRKTARRLKIHSDSSHRFERGVDPNGVPWFLHRAIELIVQTQTHLGHTPTLISQTLDLYPKPILPTQLDFPVKEYTRHIGLTFDPNEMTSILNALNLPTTLSDDNATLHTTIPTFRPDITRTIDLVEEIARVHGYEENLPAILPTGRMGYAHTFRSDAAARAETIVPLQDDYDLSMLREGLLSNGLYECVNYTFIDSGDTEKLGFAENDVRSHPIRLRNPVADDMNTMRTSLLPGLMKNLKHNRAHQRNSVALFEMGRVYLRQDMRTAPLPEHTGGIRWGTHTEPLHLAAVVTGNRSEHFTGARPWDIFTLRGLAQDLLESFTQEQLSIQPLQDPPLHLHPYACGMLLIGDTPVGHIASLHPDYLKTWNIDAEVFAFEVDLALLLTLRKPLQNYTPTSPYPSSQRDFALAVAKDLPYSALNDAVTSFNDSRLVGHSLFDLYTGEQLEEGKKSWAISVTFRDAQGTLSEEALTTLHSSLIEHLTSTLNATLR